MSCLCPADKISSFHERHTDSPGDRRLDVGIGEIQFGLSEIGLCGLDRRIRLVASRSGCNHSRLRGRGLFVQFFLSICLNFCLLEFGLICGNISLSSLNGGGILSLFDLVENLTFLDILAVGEFDRVQKTSNPRPDLCHLNRFGRSRLFQVDGDITMNRPGNSHLRRRWSLIFIRRCATAHCQQRKRTQPAK